MKKILVLIIILNLIDIILETYEKPRVVSMGCEDVHITPDDWESSVKAI